MGRAGAGPFAARHGLEQDSVEVNRRQYVGGPPRARAAGTPRRLRAAPVAGLTPAADLPAMAELIASINDAPNDDLDLEDEVFPPSASRRTSRPAGPRAPVVPVGRAAPGDRPPRGHTVVAVDGERPSSATSTTRPSSPRTAATGSACCSRPT